ncbi:TetR/AcrR family transcriptional regulator [Glycomyces terrestris]|uniref:TetR/AcrR family transcriptional regulator n=1 Tax=Glycomyces terrestris TaxID=2493553 RepID=A0A426V3R0_9ACTN|nr:TetR/AcrR family transcriptional regulator [Glycomyces terrestris]RRS01549.1 TetR/AcrR family transcriptional regulator [Glycomyces terrestris]
MIATVKTSMRDRLTEAATRLFYADGLRAVSVDKVIEAAGTTKVTFYRHFKSKDELVVAYLEGRALLEREGLGAAIEQGGGDPEAVLRLMAEQIGLLACAPGFRGCPFINAAAEYPDPDTPVRRTVDAHRRWTKSAFASLAAPLGPDRAAEVADDLMLLRDGVMVAGYLDEPARISASFLRSGRAVLEGARAD